MPRNVRNFWVEAEVEGRKSKIAFGPQGKEDGFRLTVYIRNKGEVEEVAHVEGASIEGRTLMLWVDCAGEEVKICRER